MPHRKEIIQNWNNLGQICQEEEAKISLEQCAKLNTYVNRMLKGYFFITLNNIT